MKALILSGGKGEKFRPFSYYRPKSMFPIANCPLMEYALKRIVKAEIKEIGIIVGYRGGRIKSYFGDGRKWGCQITYLEQPTPLGTGDAVLRSKPWVGEDDFIVIYGDIYFPDGIIEKLEKEIGRAKTGIAVIQDGKGQADKGIASEIAGGKVYNYHWKHSNYRSFPVFCGIYGFRKEIWRYLPHLPEITEEVKNGVFPLEEKELASVSKICAEDKNPLLSMKVEGVIDMDFPWQPLEIYRVITKHMGDRLTKTMCEEDAEIEKGAKIEGNVHLARGARICKGSYVKGPVWIGENSVILEGSHLSPYTVIGKHCEIGPYCQISGSIGNGCEIGYLAKVSGVVLDHSVIHHAEVVGVFGERFDAGEGTLVGDRRFDDQDPKIMVQGVLRDAEGWSGVFVGDYCRTGVGAMLMPGRIIGPCSIVGPGVVVTKNVAPYKAVLLKQELKIIDWGPEIYDK